MSAELDLAGSAATPGRHVGATLATIAIGWGVAALCYAGGPGTDVPALAAALGWWVAVVAIVRSDLAHYIIPDGASAAVALLGLVQAVAVPIASGAGFPEATFAGVSALGTGAGAFLLFWAVGLVFRRIRGREALGFGDVKLAGASALWLAPGDAALALEIAALGAVAVLLIARRRNSARETAVPFGAFLAPAAWLVYVAGPLVRGMA